MELDIDAWLGEDTPATDEQKERLKEAYAQIVALWAADAQQRDAALVGATEVIVYGATVDELQPALDYSTAMYAGAILADNL